MSESFHLDDNLTFSNQWGARVERHRYDLAP